MPIQRLYCRSADDLKKGDKVILKTVEGELYPIVSKIKGKVAKDALRGKAKSNTFKGDLLWVDVEVEIPEPEADKKKEEVKPDDSS